ncbi:hypothetical protein ACFQ0T_42065 [Kitasatospora gansuensis]
MLIDCLAADPAERARHTMDTLLPRIRAAAAETAPAPRRVLRRGPWTVLGAVLLAGAVTAAWIAWPSGDAGTGPTVAATKPIRVYNMDGNCKDLTERVPACSLGLARDPHRKYAAGNVVSHRVWHDDVLLTDCVINDGDRVEDENGIGTPAGTGSGSTRSPSTTPGSRPSVPGTTRRPRSARPRPPPRPPSPRPRPQPADPARAEALRTPVTEGPGPGARYRLLVEQVSALMIEHCDGARYLHFCRLPAALRDGSAARRRPPVISPCCRA